MREQPKGPVLALIAICVVAVTVFFLTYWYIVTHAVESTYGAVR